MTEDSSYDSDVENKGVRRDFDPGATLTDYSLLDKDDISVPVGERLVQKNLITPSQKIRLLGLQNSYPEDCRPKVGELAVKQLHASNEELAEVLLDSEFSGGEFLSKEDLNGLLDHFDKEAFISFHAQETRYKNLSSRVNGNQDTPSAGDKERVVEDDVDFN